MIIKYLARQLGYVSIEAAEAAIQMTTELLIKERDQLERFGTRITDEYLKAFEELVPLRKAVGHQAHEIVLLRQRPGRSSHQ